LLKGSSRALSSSRGRAQQLTRGGERWGASEEKRKSFRWKGERDSCSSCQGEKERAVPALTQKKRGGRSPGRSKGRESINQGEGRGERKGLVEEGGGKSLLRKDIHPFSDRVGNSEK